MSTITHINTALPNRKIEQSDFAEYYSSLTDEEQKARQIKMVCNRSGIDKRHTVVPDLDELEKLNIDDKMKLYHRHSSSLAIESIKGLELNRSELDSFTDLITISCTGMQAPGIEFQLIKEFGLKSNIKRYNINFMGCYAAITGLRLAQEICKTEGRKVLLLSVELCTLHFQKNFESDYILSNSLFADGAAAVVISSSDEQGLRISDSESRIIANSEEDMSWKISATGFLMNINSKIPQFIKDTFLQENLYQRDLKELQWAIHPGGRQILDSIEEGMGFSNKLNRSREVLQEYGNMSSATILFVLERFLKAKGSDEDIIACAFGPGLSFESVLLNVVER